MSMDADFFFRKNIYTFAAIVFGLANEVLKKNSQE